MKASAPALRIILKSFNPSLLKSAVQKLLGLIIAAGSNVKGPVALPTKFRKFDVLRSPHVDKRARDQYEIRSHKRLVDVTSVNPKTLEALMRAELPTEVKVQVRIQSP